MSSCNLESMNSIVYGLVDPQTKQLRYIGKSQRGISRPKQHSMPTYLKASTHKNNWIRSLLAKELKPEIVIIQSFDDNDILSQAEIHWIAYFKAMGCPLTNQCRGGEGFTGPHTDESKRKIGLGARRPMSEEIKRHLSEASKGRPLSEKHRLALRVPHKPLSESTKQKMSRARLGRPMSPQLRAAVEVANKKRRKPIIDNLGRTYESQSQAARVLGLHQSSILKVLKGRLLRTGGFSFRYIDGAR